MDSSHATPVRLGDYLIERRSALGVAHMFGVPGDFVLSFMSILDHADSPIQLVGTCDEQGAGFAADAYARIMGIGACCVTYGVGGLKVANSAGQAYAEKSPVVYISGGPGKAELARNPLIHHRIRDFNTQLRVFDQLTVAAAIIDDLETACRDIDRILHTCLRESRPVYIELPRDLVMTEVPRWPAQAQAPRSSEPASLRAAIDDVVGTLEAAKHPVFVVGVEVSRFGVDRLVQRLIERTGAPFVTTMLGKSALSETHPQFAGVYAGAMGAEATRRYVEQSDCIILLGAILNDLNLGGHTAHLDRALEIDLSVQHVGVGYRTYADVWVGDVLRALADTNLPVWQAGDHPRPCKPVVAQVSPETPVTNAALIDRLSNWLDANTVVIADPGDALFGSIDLVVAEGEEFLSSAYYASLGFAVPAAVGVKFARPDRRPLVLVGDGAFQMTGMEFSTALHHGQNPVVILLNNDGYTTERLILEGGFNDILRWNYHRLPEVWGRGVGVQVRTMGELDDALAAAKHDTDNAWLIEVMLERRDFSPALRRLGEALAISS